jgi:hypothetical protein
MALKLDSSRALRSYDQLVALVRSIYESDDDGAEDSAVEWKSSLDLGTASGAFHAARTILGLANRSVAVAGKQFDGAGYLVVGVEPGNLPGMPRWDGEKLGPSLARYLGTDGPVWSHQNITFEGANVVVITVEPPVAGDPIRTLRKEYSGDGSRAAAEGTIFVRRSGRTDRAGSADIGDLQRRLLDGAAAGRPDVDLGSNASEYRALRAADRPDEVEKWIETVRAEFLKPMLVAQRASRPIVAATAGVIAPESRSEEKYRTEVERYLAEFREGAPTMLRHFLSESALRNPLQLSLRNNEDEALEDVLVEISTPADVQQYFSEVPWQDPRQPRKWGHLSVAQSMGLPDLSAVSAMRLPQPELHSGSWISRQELAVLHGETTVNLEPFTVLAAEQVLEDEISIRVTARNRRGSVRFHLAVDFPSAISWNDLDLRLGKGHI